MKVVFILGCLCLAFVGFSNGDKIANDAIAFCESEVPKFCVKTTCPLFCSTVKTQKQKDECKSRCTISDRCKLHPVGLTNHDATNVALDAQNRDQLFACIAEVRDPEGTKTGRRMIPWRDIRTPSFEKAVKV